MRNYCLPILKHKKEDVLNTIKSTKDYQFYEVWLDYIQDIDREFIETLEKNYSGKLIFVFRRLNLETPQMNQATRLSLIKLFDKSQMYIDLDVITQQEELSFITENMMQIPLITSYHNYQETPDDRKLIEIIVLMERYGPQIVKVATHCQEPKDGLRLLDLLISLKSENKKYIILGMGQHGTVTRLYGTLWGNEMIFAPEKESEVTAVGQFTKKQYEEIFKLLNPGT